MSRETDSSSSGPPSGGGAAYPSGTPPYGTRRQQPLTPEGEWFRPEAGDPPGQDGEPPAPAPREPKTETTLTTRVRINIPGSRPIPPVVLRQPVGDKTAGRAAGPAGDRAEPATPPAPARPSGAAGRPVGRAAAEGAPTRNGAVEATQPIPRWAGPDAARPPSSGAAPAPHGAPTDPDSSGANGNGANGNGAGPKQPSDWFTPRRPPGSTPPSGTPAAGTGFPPPAEPDGLYGTDTGRPAAFSAPPGPEPLAPPFGAPFAGPLSGPPAADPFAGPPPAGEAIGQPGARLGPFRGDPAPAPSPGLPPARDLAGPPLGAAGHRAPGEGPRGYTGPPAPNGYPGPLPGGGPLGPDGAGPVPGAALPLGRPLDAPPGALPPGAAPLPGAPAAGPLGGARPVPGGPPAPGPAADALMPDAGGFPGPGAAPGGAGPRRPADAPYDARYDTAGYDTAPFPAIGPDVGPPNGSERQAGPAPAAFGAGQVLDPRPPAAPAGTGDPLSDPLPPFPGRPGGVGPGAPEPQGRAGYRPPKPAAGTAAGGPQRGTGTHRAGDTLVGGITPLAPPDPLATAAVPPGAAAPRAGHPAAGRPGAVPPGAVPPGAVPGAAARPGPAEAAPGRQAPAEAPAERAPAAAAPARKRRSKPMLALMTLLSLAGAAYLAGLLVNHADVPNGTVALGVDIGGDSRQQAAAALAAVAGERSGGPLRISVGGATHELPPEVAGLAVDTDATVQAVARRDYNPVAVIGALFGGRHVATPVITVDQEKLLSQLDALSPAADGSAGGLVKFVAGTPVAVPGRAYQAIDRDAAVSRITDAFERRAETGADPTVVLPVATHEPAVTEATMQQAIRTIGDPAMSGLITVQAGNASVPFSPQKSLSQILTIVPVPGTDKMALHINLQVLQSLYGNAFDGVLLERGDGSRTPVTPQDVASAMLPQLSRTAAKKTAVIPNVAK